MEIQNTSLERLSDLSKKLVSLLDNNVIDKPDISPIFIYGNKITSTYKTSYKPYDKAYILELIDTYSEQNWDLPRNVKLNPLVCSLNGLKCISRNRVCCNTCIFTTFIKVPTDDPELIEILASRYLDMLHTFHYESCPWKLKAADIEKSYNISYNSMNIDFEVNKIRLALILNISKIKDLPKNISKEIEKLNVTKIIDFEGILIGFGMEASIRNMALLKLTMSGWEWVANSKNLNVLKCACCNTILTDDFNLIDSSDSKLLIDSHMPWCCLGSEEAFDILSNYLTDKTWLLK